MVVTLKINFVVCKVVITNELLDFVACNIRNGETIGIAS